MSTKLCRDLIAAAMFLLIMTAVASAALTINEQELSFGGNSQSKVTSNGNLIVLTKTFTLAASTNYYNSIASSFTPQNNFPSSNVAITGLNSTLNATESMTVTVNLTVPGDFDAINNALKESGFDIGTLTVTGTEFYTNGTATGATGQDTLPLKLQIENEISLEKIELKKEDGSTSDITSTSTVQAQAEQDLEFIFYIKNKFSNGTNVEFSDVEINMDIEDVGDDSSSISGIDPGETDDKSVSFTFNNDDEGKHKVILEISGTDEFGGLHGLTKEFDININEAPEEPTDSDADGVPDGQDQCGSTPSYCTVNGQGCPLDKDNDGICDAIDTIDNSLIIPTTQNNEQQDKTTIKKQPSKTNTTQDETKTKKKSDDGSAYFIPFLFGFLAGALIATGFFFFLKS